jgi:hypothetical protein
MLGQMMVEGAARAAQLVPLLFVLNTTSPASAQLPRPTPATPDARFAAALDESSPLTLTEHHVDVRIKDNRAHVRSLLTYRNERADPVSTSFAFPFPTLLGQGDTWRALGAESVEPGDCAVDEPPDQAEFIEAGEPLPPRIDVGFVTVAPGEEITLETHRVIELAARWNGYRLALPLPVDRSAPYSPQFSADVMVEEAEPVTRIVSLTHGGTASGTGATRARLAVPSGRAYSGTQFLVDVDFGTSAVKSGYAQWGGETHAR